MQRIDYLVLAGYFALMIVIGIISSRRIKAQEDYFMGGRSFGKLLQTFAAFGAGTGSSDPVNIGRTTFTGGMSGVWSVMSWLFVTPFYWITGVWYRRMRHLTLGDWFVERYQSKALGAAYCVFGLLFFMIYGSMLFSAIGKVAAPLVGTGEFTFVGQTIGIEYLLVPLIGLVVLAYGIAGGLEAAYYTDLIQGLCIILLSIILIPYGLNALVEKFGDPSTQGMMDGFRIIHEQLPQEHFSVVGSASTSEFPLHRILAVVLISLVGIVVQPHMIAAGGGSAKTETDARIGLVAGNFLKRFCTIGWVLTALIALALFADNRVLIADPDKTWGIASKELLGPGLTGLMLACLLAALMSSVDVYMIVGSALVVRNIYAPYINPNATEKQYVTVGRMTGVIVVGGAVIISLFMMDVFKQLQLTWIVPVLFAAPFWIGMYWRRATTAAAWMTIAFCALAFFLLPAILPVFMPDLRSNPKYLGMNQEVKTVTMRFAAPSDRKKRDAAIANWEHARANVEAARKEYQNAAKSLAAGTFSSGGESNATASTKSLKQVQEALKRLIDTTTKWEKLGDKSKPIKVGEPFGDVVKTGGKSVFWSGGVKPVDEHGNVLDAEKPRPIGKPQQRRDNTTRVVMRYGESVQLKGFGNFQLDFLLYELCGMNFTTKSNATLSTLELPPKIVAPFLVMILLSLLTGRNSKEALDRYYAKMKTPVDPDPETDRRNLDSVYANPGQTEERKLFPGTSLEIQKPTAVDVIGFVVCTAVCFAIIGLAVWVANIGG